MPAQPPHPPLWTLAHGRSILLDRPRLMAVINCTPDSFHEASRAGTAESALDAAMRGADEGADMLDLGGESTRPGSLRVDAQEQIRRVVPAIERIRAQAGTLGRIPISVDTTLAPVARAALQAGADAVNDVSGCQDDPSLLEVASEHGCGLVLMHRLLPPERDTYSDQYSTPPEYGDVVWEVRKTLMELSKRAAEAGVGRGSIVWDPGLGFGKGIEDTLRLLRRSGELQNDGYPLLSALSRKSFVGRLSLGRDSSPGERLCGSLALSVLQLWVGARLFRVHDVAQQREALSAAWAVLRTAEGG